MVILGRTSLLAATGQLLLRHTSTGQPRKRSRAVVVEEIGSRRPAGTCLPSCGSPAFPRARPSASPPASPNARSRACPPCLPTVSAVPPAAPLGTAGRAGSGGGT